MPYDRPPLSKHFLAGEWELDKVVLRPEAEFVELDFEVKRGPGNRAVHLDVEAGAVTLASGEQVRYDGLVLATGARARMLPGYEALGDRVHLLRTLDDSLALRAFLSVRGRRLLLVGAGFIGMEVAATASTLGAAVTVVEPLSVPLGRVLGEMAGNACAAMHRDHGVELLMERSVSSVAELSDHTIAATLTDGSVLETDAILIGIGATPNVEWLEGSGLDVCVSGVACDSALRAGPGIVVAGDLAYWPHGPGQDRVRVEHRTNAAEQGDHAAASLLGSEEPFVTVPYVWSDQYDVKIQVLGLPSPDDECVVVDGSLAEGRWVGVYGRGGRFSAAVGFHKPRSLMRLRPLLTRDSSFDEALHALD